MGCTARPLAADLHRGAAVGVDTAPVMQPPRLELIPTPLHVARADSMMHALAPVPLACSGHSSNSVILLVGEA